MALRINIASGTDIRPGWVNLDVTRHWGADITWDARHDALPFVDGSVDEAFAGYLLLHLAPCHHARVLAEIRRVCHGGSLITFREVDMEPVMLRFLQDPFDTACHDLIWGEQGVVHGAALAEFDKHCHGFTRASLRATLNAAGFKDIASKPADAGVWYDLYLTCMRG